MTREASHDAEDDRLREALRESEGPFRAWFERTGLGIAQIATPTGRFVRANRTYCELVGFSREEMERTEFQAITHPDDLEADLAHMRRLVAGEISSFSMEKRYRHRSGDVVWVNLTVTPLWAPGETPDYHLAIVEDITARKRAESEKALVFERISDAFVALDRDWRYTFVNEKAGELFGRTPESLVGKHIWTEFPEGLGQPFHEAYERAMRTQEPETLEAYFEPWDRWYENRIFPGPDGITIYFHDITERRRGEERRALLERQLRRSQRLDSLGQLASGVAHDMNNVLAAIQAVASSMTGPQVSRAELDPALATIHTACERGGDLVRRLLAFAGERPARSEPVDVNELVREHVKLFERTQLARVSVELQLAQAPLWVLGDASALSHALMNLSVNAAQAMPGGGRMTMGTRLEGGQVVVEVADEGVGMSQDVLEQALDPFFTTKPPGQGTGLGLSIAFSTLRGHGGSLDLESTPGSGTRAILRLPSIDRPTAPAPSEPSDGKGDALAGLRVLLVDDDELVRNAVRALLETLRCRVDVAADGEAALGHLESDTDVHVVVLDMHMPGLGGARTLARLRERHPALPVLLATGNPDALVLRAMEEHGPARLLSKPFAMADVRAALLAVLQAGSV